MVRDPCSEHDPGRGGEVSGVVFQAFCCYRDFSCPGCWEVSVITNQQFELFSPDQNAQIYGLLPPRTPCAPQTLCGKI